MGQMIRVVVNDACKICETVGRLKFVETDSPEFPMSVSGEVLTPRGIVMVLPLDDGFRMDFISNERLYMRTIYFNRKPSLKFAAELARKFSEEVCQKC